MGLFDKLKQQGMNILQQGADALSEFNNNQGANASQSSERFSESADNQNYSQMSPPTPPETSSAQKNAIYGDYMEHLIEMALADGELTEKEKQVLFKKAEANGIDLDEFEMVLDAKLYERQKAMEVQSPLHNSSAPQSDKYGDIKKCPNCGAIVESFQARCLDCGHEFRNIGTVSSFTLLSSKLEELDSQKNGKMSIFGATHDFTIDEKKKSLIQSFPIPTTKEDILEFLSMGAPLGMPATKGRLRANIDYSSYNIASAWKSKCEQVIIKARFSMKDDRDLLDQIDSYAKILKMK